jgi:hypothetical protein
MRITVMVTSLMATALLAGCGEGVYTPQAPVGEAQTECFGYEQIFTDPATSVLDRAEARERFFENDCVLRGGSYG